MNAIFGFFIGLLWGYAEHKAKQRDRLTDPADSPEYEGMHKTSFITTVDEAYKICRNNFKLKQKAGIPDSTILNDVILEILGAGKAKITLVYE